MGKLQRYVSDELTHFVGRGLHEEAQFRLMVRILEEGHLSPPPHDPEPRGRVTIDPDGRVSRNEAYEPEAVCFCDIPVGDLDIHIQKYSPFGLAFRKPFLVERGASPVFYVAGASRTLRRDLRAGKDAETTRADYFDEMVRAYHQLRAEAEKALVRLPPGAPERGHHEALLRLADFLDFEVWSYLKFFEYPLHDEDPENYYMEREWRLLGALRFSLDDVRRVILPESYAREFRKTFPGYHGQIIFGTAGGEDSS